MFFKLFFNFLLWTAIARSHENVSIISQAWDWNIFTCLMHTREIEKIMRLKILWDFFGLKWSWDSFCCHSSFSILVLKFQRLVVIATVIVVFIYIHILCVRCLLQNSSVFVNSHRALTLPPSPPILFSFLFSSSFSK